jgi:phospholipase C
MTSKIEHVIVLMMENRSFDHLLGFLDHPDPAFPRLTGNEGIGNAKVAPNACFEIRSPDHSHAGVMSQLFGADNYDHKQWKHPSKAPYPTTGRNQGFMQSYFYRCDEDPSTKSHIMRCFHPEMIPVISGLARNYAVCINWHCSVPGETWPNRDFAVAAQSFGRVNQAYERRPGPTIFDRLMEAQQSWRIYHDTVAHTWLYPGLFFKGGFASTSQLLDDIQNDKLPKYSFIEPDYGIGTSNSLFKKLGISGKIGDTYGNSHHPSQASSGAEFLAGEYLIAAIYNTLLKTMEKSPGGDPTKSVFAKTLFVITYDEHGGFYDHVPPPPAEPPNDLVEAFAFDLLGPRVPALLISPWIPKGKIVTDTFDHSSIPATVRKLFAPDTDPLTRRDAAANTFEGVLGDKLRTASDDDKLHLMKPLEPDEARDVEERRGATKNPADIAAQEDEEKRRKEWLWLAQKTQEYVSPGPSKLAPEVEADPDKFVRAITEIVHQDA